MFVIIVDYVKPLADVDPWLEAHRAFLREQYAAGRFLASGPRRPRTGGVILAHARERAEVEALLENDPFKREGVAAYTILEFDPVMTCPELAPVLGKPR
ncbi:YciI family protein [Desulfolutivibrio sulfoxidireducens]|uniref:YciI family protein n=1 Tax=Desulfolutivibrio sulfoxidireducens TaxID=2773299 RepID=UPI00159E090B|nr:YciI family protein [Desulfolutivibrio sulfoxidireducens]QLA17120.1 GTP cyclohydrolase [Desulfolutivibrio sulfoxidireducens]QLA20687.1 GTP cyclohydrolase [Desulfolutivibrio sulfoxidireducens]